MRLGWLLLLVLAGWASAADELARFTKNNVTVVIALERSDAGRAATLIGTFTPDSPDLHLYASDLPEDAEAGVATRLDAKPGSPWKVAGPAVADQKPHLLEGLPVYPEGPVTLRVPITLPASDGAMIDTEVLVSYLACTKTTCRIPVQKKAIAIKLPTVKADTANASPAAPAVDLEAIRAAVRAELRAEAARQEQERSGAVHWLRIGSVAEAKSALAEAKAAGKPALLDFTGPSCVNCQKMEKTVFRAPSVVKAVGALAAISVDTDPPHEDLAQWEQDEFKTQNRPLYVRISPSGEQARWNEVFSPDDAEAMGRFLAFLGGQGGSDKGVGAGGAFWLLAVLGGLVTLLMPCTYPMIPFTLNFFAKQAAGGKSVLPLAAFYAAGIVACFVGLGVLITGVFGAQLSTVAGHPVTNLIIGLLFIVLGLSLLGLFLLRLPSALENRLGGGRGGYIGALIMGLTFAVTAFSCTAPFAGSVLAEAVTTGSWVRAVEGMAVYGATVAIPFFALAMSPGALAKLPRAGAWMNEFKVVGGLVEVAAALKFLAICDVAWGWGVVGRSLTLATWAACSLVLALYLLGLFRWSGDAKVETVGIGRLLASVAFLVLGLWFGSGLCGHNLGTVESFFPGDPAP